MNKRARAAAAWKALSYCYGVAPKCRRHSLNKLHGFITKMIRVITRFAVFLLAHGVVWAQPPVQFNNSQQALQQYEASTLESLMERCTATKTEQYQSPEEVRSLRNGYVDIAEQNPQTGLYSIYVFDQDKRSFTLIDGQVLNRNGRLLLRLALPRDYGRCRLVRDARGVERLEVVHLERNYVSDAQRMQRLRKESLDLAAAVPVAPQPPACQDGKPAQRSLAGQVWVDGKPQTTSACQESQLALHERMRKLARKVHER